VSQYDDVQCFVASSQKLASAEDLHTLMQDVSREMGFDHFALFHHVGLPSNRLDGPLVTREVIALSDYPPAWVDQYLGEQMVRDDPVLLASHQTTAGFAWNRMGEMIKLSAAHRKRIERARGAGIGDGFTVPCHAPGEPSGSCNFAVSPGREVPQQNFLMAQLIGSYAFAAARTLAHRLNDLPIRQRVPLTPRLRDCIELAARGKSDWEIGQILGLSQATVTTYMQRARALYDVPTRMQVVVMALYDGEIAFDAVL
jgi:LuxR family transcriptional regulator, quorum-sensing system regulator CciR